MTDFCKETLLGGGRKLISLLLCSLALTACNDDDSIIDRTGGNNLQVEVSANFHSRAPIHESTLPDNNPIGVTLTAKDGSSYDNQNYNNIPYSATTADGKQTWIPQDKPVTLSVTEGVAMAYWPYNADAADMTAVPVETDTQTDYMYSGNVTGLSNATPKAAFQMKHAMTLIRVNVVRGTYTAAGAVTAVTAASEAFCTSGTMNVSTGALAGLAGAETPFLEEPADAIITTAGRVTEFLVLPDVTVDAASVALGVTVDGRKYNTAVEVTEAFKQGYIYTYNLTLDNTALNVSAVAVTPWEEEISVEAPEPVAEDDQYIVQVTIDSDNYTYKHNVSGGTGTIDWGDGTFTDLASYNYNNHPVHTYEKAGKYIIIYTGKISALYGVHNTSYDISRIIKIGGDLGITNMEAAFMNQKKLTEIPLGVFDGLTEVTSFGNLGHAGVFMNCTGLTGFIPEGLFDKCTKAKNFSFAFENCKGLTGPIPEGLFENCPEATNFCGTFNGCSGLTGSIPVELFKNNTKVTDFRCTFANCKNLTGSIPSGMFDNNTKVTSFGDIWGGLGCFGGCSGLIGEIPAGLFDNCPEVTSFKSTFDGCSNLTEIPAGLFDNNTKVTSFQQTFMYCGKITGAIPSGLFDNCPEVTTFYKTFFGCGGIDEIPAGLFKNNTKNNNIVGTFQGTSISSIPVGLFDSFTEITSTAEGGGYYVGTFMNCKNLVSIPEGLFDNCTKMTNFGNCFSNCPALEAIPAGLFDNCPEVTDFHWVFQDCPKLSVIPTGLFDNNTKVTTFNNAFNACRGLQNIPEGIFDNCPEVTNFGSVFRNCSGLANKIPVSIFDKNRKVTNFNQTFGGIGLSGESPYTIITVTDENGNESSVKVHLYERSLYPEHFTAPTGFYMCFYACDNLTDWAAIVAAGWN